MKHSLQVATIVIGLLGFGREARAQWSYCNSGTAYNGTCYEGTSTSGWTNISATSTAGNAVIGADTSSGNGVWGQSQTGIGVIGSSDTTDSAPTLKIGVFGEANSSSGAAVYAHNVSTSTGTNDWGVYGLSDNAWGGTSRLVAGRDMAAFSQARATMVSGQHTWRAIFRLPERLIVQVARRSRTTRISA